MIPKTDSIADKIGQYLHKFGKCSREQVVISMEGRGHAYESTRKVLRDMVNEGQIIECLDGYELADLMQKHYGNTAPATAYVGEVAGPRTANPFKPMTVTPWAQHIGRFRDVSFKNGSTDFKSFIGYLA